MWSQNPLKKMQWSSTKKVPYRPKTLTHSNKSQKLYFFACAFLQLCQRIEISTEGLKKLENLFYICVLELNFATINGLGEPSC
jgi:hypothetical protein